MTWSCRARFLENNKYIFRAFIILEGIHLEGRNIFYREEVAVGKVFLQDHDETQKEFVFLLYFDLLRVSFFSN